MCNESRKIIFCDYLAIYRSDIGDLGLVLTGTTRAIQQKKIAEIGSLDREIIFRIIGSGRVGPPKIVIRSDPFGTLLIGHNLNEKNICSLNQSIRKLLIVQSHIMKIFHSEL